MQRILFLVAFTLFLTPLIFAQEDSTHVVLKNGGEMNVLIKKVEPWGCTLSDDRMLLFRIVSELNTKDTVLVQQVMAHVDSIKIRKKGDVKILDFENAIIQKMPTPKPSGVGLKSVTFDWTFDYAMNYGFRLAFSLRALEPFIIVPGISFGNTLNTNYSMFRVSFGAGCLLEYEKTRFMALLSFAGHEIEVGSVENILLKPISLDVEEQFLTGNKNQYIIFAGGYCNLNHVVFDGKDVRFGLRAGIGLNLSVIPFFNSDTPK